MLNLYHVIFPGKYIEGSALIAAYDRGHAFRCFEREMKEQMMPMPQGLTSKDFNLIDFKVGVLAFNDGDY